MSVVRVWRRLLKFALKILNVVASWALCNAILINHSHTLPCLFHGVYSSLISLRLSITINVKEAQQDEESVKNTWASFWIIALIALVFSTLQLSFRQPTGQPTDQPSGQPSEQPSTIENSTSPSFKYTSTGWCPNLEEAINVRNQPSTNSQDDLERVDDVNDSDGEGGRST